ncbi:hypothetical protein B0H15DRAFT_798352 [Mycena belliarum]|uniref:Uncharacterized protein n=1 Tax=Mycena belliarum TaxID=1033014 RepID=A0AAD6UAE8_9AGAR|nr:hypothetical protein B0H15DRAFT_798352 [Mycena belliae]
MFGEDNRWSGAPSSSPPSSPTAYNDSSPASSPAPEDFVSLPDAAHFSGTSTRSPLLDPFAAAAKGAWVPPDYEKGGKKNRPTSPSSPTRSRAKKPRLLGPEASSDTLVAHTPRTSLSLTDAEKEDSVWDTAVARMIDNGNGAINLDNSNLTGIPKGAVAEMRAFYVPEEKAERLNARQLAPLGPQTPRQFVRSSTAPAILGAAVGSARQDIQLYLAGNQISRIPLELLGLSKLTVLSLRGNKLKTLPPDIRLLKNLRTLNLSGNQLQYLPSELLGMTLNVLNVFPNPFKKPEQHHLIKRLLRRTRSVQGRVAISPTSRVSDCVPPLVELAFRAILSAKPGIHPAPDHSERRLAQHYELPLCEDGEPEPTGTNLKKEFRHVIPPHLRHVLATLHPGSVDLQVDDTLSPDVDRDPPSLGLCPSPRHATGASVFVAPAEERFTWETVVAGVSVGGDVPLKWRGCLWGCLDFLGVDAEEPRVDKVVPDMDVDDEQDAATVVRSASGIRARELDFEDGT